MSACEFCSLVASAAHPAKIVEFEHSVSFLHVDQAYAGRSVLILKPHFEHFQEVPLPLYDEYNRELRVLAEAMRRALHPDRLNYAVLGNRVAHVHWHVIPRYQGDDNWGGPPWPVQTPIYRDEQDYRELARRIREEIRL